MGAETNDIHFQAGAMVYRVKKKRVEVLLLTSRDTQRWIIPKGNIERDKDARAAARAEAFEEAGIESVCDGETPLGFYTYFKRYADGSERPVVVEVHLLRAAKTRKKWKESGERERAWLLVADALARIEEPGVAPLLERLAALEQTLLAR